MASPGVGSADFFSGSLQDTISMAAAMSENMYCIKV
jgi:hypothetical protein